MELGFRSNDAVFSFFLLNVVCEIVPTQPSARRFLYDGLLCGMKSSELCRQQIALMNGLPVDTLLFRRQSRQFRTDGLFRALYNALTLFTQALNGHLKL